MTESKGDALERLQKWCSELGGKYRHFTLSCNGNYQPGDGTGITLHGRIADGPVNQWAKVIACDEYDDDLCGTNDDGTEKSPTFAELIHKALDRWEDGEYVQ